MLTPLVKKVLQSEVEKGSASNSTSINLKKMPKYFTNEDFVAKSISFHNNYKQRYISNLRR